MTRARLRRGVRKRREAREARERKAKRVWAASLPPPPLESNEGPEPCKHTWGEPEAVSLSCGSHNAIRVCKTCQGFVHRCKRCRGFAPNTRDLGAGRYHGPFTVPTTATSESDLDIGSICNGIVLKNNDVVSLTARLIDGDFKQLVAASNTVTWTHNTSSSLFEYQSSNVMGGLQMFIKTVPPVPPGENAETRMGGMHTQFHTDLQRHVEQFHGRWNVYHRALFREDW